MRIIALAAGTILTLAFACTGVANAACPCCKPAPAKKPAIFSSSLKSKQVVLSVTGMTCTSCAAKVEKALSTVAGVRQVQVDLKSQQAIVTVETDRYDQGLLEKALEKSGYPGKVLK